MDTITITLPSLHPQAPQAGQNELDELYGRWMAAANADGFDGENPPQVVSQATEMAWERYQAAKIYWTYGRTLEVTQ